MKARRPACGVCILVLLGLSWWSGCGVKNEPLPPQGVLPEPIVDLRARSTTNGIELTWSRPERYRNGNRMRDLSDFVVLRAPDHQPLKPLAQLALTDRERFQHQRRLFYIDTNTLLGRHYRYQVISRTTDGYESPPSNEIALSRTPPEPAEDKFALPTPHGHSPPGSGRQQASPRGGPSP